MKSPVNLITGLLLIAIMIILPGCSKKDMNSQIQPKIDKLLEYWNTGIFDGIEDILCEDFEMRITPLYEPEKGIDNFKKTVTATRNAYPDFTIAIHETIYTNNAGAGRWTITCTNKSGKTMTIPGMSILHFKDGKIKDEWIANNDYAWQQQMGYTLIPPATIENQ